jgi:hypothetical protein
VVNHSLESNTFSLDAFFKAVYKTLVFFTEIRENKKMAATNRQIIQTGFSTIYWQGEPHRPSTVINGQNLLDAEHLQNVEEIQETGKDNEILSKCVRQTSVRLPPYTQNLTLDEHRIVQLARCSCIGGSDGLCKHVSALVTFINTERDESKTDKACAFRKPSKKGDRLYPKGKELDDIFKFTDRMEVLTFVNATEEDKKEYYDVMKASGNTSSPMFKICGPLRLKVLIIKKLST